MVKEFQYFQLGTWNCKLDYNIFHRFVVVEIYLKKTNGSYPFVPEKPYSLLKIKRLNKYEKLWKKIIIWNNLHLQKQTNKQKVSFMGKFWHTTLRWHWNTPRPASGINPVTSIQQPELKSLEPHGCFEIKRYKNNLMFHRNNYFSN